MPAIRVISSVKENGPSPGLNGQLALGLACLLIFVLGWQALALFSRLPRFPQGFLPVANSS